MRKEREMHDDESCYKRALACIRTTAERPCPTLGPVPVQRRYYHLGRLLHRGHSVGGFTMCLLGSRKQNKKIPSSSNVTWFSFGGGGIFFFVVVVAYAFIEFCLRTGFFVSYILISWWGLPNRTRKRIGPIEEVARDFQLGLTRPLGRWLDRLRVETIGTAETFKERQVTLTSRGGGTGRCKLACTTCCDVFLRAFSWPIHSINRESR